jgi:prepilin-type N-terminal cleavage/methylation domain-containing protein
MARKYTILKVLIQNLNKGFTLIELIVGLLIMVIVGGLAMNALVEASNTFNNDKKNIDSSQNLSAVLELIGNDIRQSGEQISDDKFPTIEIKQNPIYLTSGNTTISDSSTITIRRALSTALPLCEQIAAGADPTTIIVADGPGTTAGATPLKPTSCKPFVGTAPTTPVPVLPNALREARNYRCKLDDLNADYSSNTADFCQTSAQKTAAIAAGTDLEKVRAVVSDQNGHIRTFQYSDDDTATANLYKIKINSISTDANHNVAYDIGKPIYLIEERTYTLNSQGNLTVSIDGGAANTLISGIARFKVSAKGYTNATDKIISTNVPTALDCAATDGVRIPTTPTTQDPKYACKFNNRTAVGDPAYDWKMLAGIKVELQARYDSTGRATEANALTKDIDKLQAAAEFFPRNVLSK